MRKYKTRVKLPGVKIFEKIRKKLGITKYRMANLLEKSHPAYAYLEESKGDYIIVDLARLRELSKMSWEEFGSLIDQDAARARKLIEKAKKAKLEEP